MSEINENINSSSHKTQNQNNKNVNSNGQNTQGQNIENGGYF